MRCVIFTKPSSATLYGSSAAVTAVAKPLPYIGWQAAVRCGTK